MFFWSNFFIQSTHVIMKMEILIEALQRVPYLDLNAVIGVIRYFLELLIIQNWLAVIITVVILEVWNLSPGVSYTTLKSEKNIVMFPNAVSHHFFKYSVSINSDSIQYRLTCYPMYGNFDFEFMAIDLNMSYAQEVSVFSVNTFWQIDDALVRYISLFYVFFYF